MTTNGAHEPCGDPTPFVLTEPSGPRREFSVHGYVARTLRLTRSFGGAELTHCVTVAWPPGSTNNDGKPCSVAKRIDAAWFRTIENTLARVPWAHVQQLRLIVIDNRPKEHGIAPFDRNDPDDARDGHTIWLHEHLFVHPNHWQNGNHGAYWSYHVDEDGSVLDDLPDDHDRFSPVLLHELGHIVMYNVINTGADRTGTPGCARTCGDAGNCASVGPVEREAGCVSPYCMPFRFQAGTENWAEQYRFHYQSSTTRALLLRARAQCATILAEQDEGLPPPWERGLPDIPKFRKSLWRSCGGRACKPF